MALIRICESDNFFVDYDTGRGMYRVSTFEPGVERIKEEYWFDAYEEKELDKSFPQTIGDITYYSKAELFAWVEHQQKINMSNGIVGEFVGIPITKENINKILLSVPDDYNFEVGM